MVWGTIKKNHGVTQSSCGLDLAALLGPRPLQLARALIGIYVCPDGLPCSDEESMRLANFYWKICN